MDVEELLRHNFEDRAGRVEASGSDLHLQAVQGARRQRRGRAAMAGVGLAVALIVATPLTIGVLADRTAGGTAGDGNSADDIGLYGMPTRGDLAGDADFVAGVDSIEWSADVGVNGTTLRPTADERRVLFAGEVPGDERWALVMAEVGPQLIAAWFTGPAGAAGEDLTLAREPERASADVPLALVDARRAEGALVVITMPGDDVEYSPAVERDSTGALMRIWEKLPPIDGVAVGQVTAPVLPLAAEVRVSRDDVVVHRFPPPRLEAADDQPVERSTWAGSQGEYVEAMVDCLVGEGHPLEIVTGGDGWYYTPGDEQSTAEQHAYTEDVAACQAAVGGK